MPLTEFQQSLLATFAHGAADGSYLAGGAAIHFAPNTTRYSNDLDFFHDSVARVAAAFQRDLTRAEADGYRVQVEISQPGFIRAEVSRGDASTRVDWAHDSAWRFMPLVHEARGGLLLHPVDLAVNKVLALAGRDESRDYVDILFIDEHVLPLGTACWAAAGKDPGFTPLSLLELLKRRGRFRAEEFTRLRLREPFDVVAAKERWHAALETAGQFVRKRPSAELGCLYWSTMAEAFVMPGPDDAVGEQLRPHFGRPGGVVPQVNS